MKTDVAIEIKVGTVSVEYPIDAIEHSRDRQPASSVKDAHASIPLVASLAARPEKAFCRIGGHGQGVREGDLACGDTRRHAARRFGPCLADHVHAAIMRILVAHAGNDGFHCCATAVNRNHLAAQVVTALSCKKANCFFIAQGNCMLYRVLGHGHLAASIVCRIRPHRAMHINSSVAHIRQASLCLCD